MATLAEEFSSRSPWVTSFEIAGDHFGGDYDASGDERLIEFLRRYPRPGRVLELGCLEGGHTVPIARVADEVVAVDCRSENIEKATFIRETFGLTNIRFVSADLDLFDVRSLGTFDTVFNVGLLYHLAEPWRLLESIAQCCREMFLWTHIARHSWWGVKRSGYRGRLYREGGQSDPLSGLNAESFWPTQAELCRMLNDRGFGDIEILDIDRIHPHGPAILLVCRSHALGERRVASWEGAAHR